MRTIVGTDDRGFPATVTVDVTEPSLPSTTMLVGVTVDPSDLGRLLRYPGARATRLFWGPGQGYPTWADKRLVWLKANCPQVVPHVSFKDWPDDKTVRARVHGFLDGLTAPAANESDPLAVVTWMHEPEPKQVDPAPYRRNWWTLAGIVGDHRNGAVAQISPIQTLQWTAAPGKGGGDLSRYYMGVGLPGIDCYADSWAKSYPNPAKFLSLALQLADRANQPPCLPELGAARLATDKTGQGRAAWIREVAAILRSEGCRMVSWWDDLGTGGTDFRLDDQPSADGWRDVIAGRV